MDSSISFTANHIKNLQILKKNQKGLVPKEVSFVEFQPEDIDAINEFRYDLAGSSWHKMYDKDDFKSLRFYGLTTQTDSFDKINHDKILGFMETTKDRDVIINMKLRQEAKQEEKYSLLEKIIMFGVCPEGKRTYHKVGTALIDGLKSTTDRIAVFSPKKIRGFFTKNGFKNPLPDDKKYLTWEKTN